jgi:hypothetical protein
MITCSLDSRGHMSHQCFTFVADILALICREKQLDTCGWDVGENQKGRIQFAERQRIPADRSSKAGKNLYWEMQGVGVSQHGNFASVGLVG